MGMFIDSYIYHVHFNSGSLWRCSLPEVTDQIWMDLHDDINDINLCSICHSSNLANIQRSLMNDVFKNYVEQSSHQPLMSYRARSLVPSSGSFAGPDTPLISARADVWHAKSSGLALDYASILDTHIHAHTRRVTQTSKEHTKITHLNMHRSGSVLFCLDCMWMFGQTGFYRLQNQCICQIGCFTINTVFSIVFKMTSERMTKHTSWMFFLQCISHFETQSHQPLSGPTN